MDLAGELGQQQAFASGASADGIHFAHLEERDHALRDRARARLASQPEGVRRAVLIVNARSRSGARAFRDARERLVKAGITLEGAYAVRKGSTLSQIVAREIAQGRKFIIVGGGDGTISSVSGYFANTDVVFGVLPLGTANSFARALRLPLDLDGAIDVLAHGTVEDVDLGRIGERHFTNGCSIGMPAIVGLDTPHGLKAWLGRGAYALVAAARFATYRGFRCTITGGGREVACDALEIRIANGAYQGGVLVAREASPENGLIVLHVVRGASRWALAREWSRVALGLPLRAAEVDVLKARQFRIETTPQQAVAVDGEVVARTPIDVSVASQSLLVMSPR